VNKRKHVSLSIDASQFQKFRTKTAVIYTIAQWAGIR
jgi:hypothetical protein